MCLEDARIMRGAASFTAGIAIGCAQNNAECLIAGRVSNDSSNGCTAMVVPLSHLLVLMVPAQNME